LAALVGKREVQGPVADSRRAGGEAERVEPVGR
jgi:hypothetical protein